MTFIGKQSTVPVILRDIFQPEGKETIRLIFQAKKIFSLIKFLHTIFSECNFQNDALTEMGGIFLKKIVDKL